MICVHLKPLKRRNETAMVFPGSPFGIHAKNSPAEKEQTMVWRDADVRLWAGNCPEGLREFPRRAFGGQKINSGQYMTTGHRSYAVSLSHSVPAVKQKEGRRPAFSSRDHPFSAPADRSSGSEWISASFRVMRQFPSKNAPSSIEKTGAFTSPMIFPAE